MKKMMILAVMMGMTISAAAMSYNKAKNEALFLSDKMAYELNLTNAQYDAVYEINLDYLMSVDNRADVFGPWWNRRNADLRYVLTGWQYDKYIKLNYFYRPISWSAGNWLFSIYKHYTDKHHLYNVHPTVFGHYKGGNNHRGDRFYADKHVNKPTSTPKSNSTMPGRGHDDGRFGNHSGNHTGNHADNHANGGHMSGKGHQSTHRAARP